MEILFEVVFLEDAFGFLKTLEPKHSAKILYNIRKAPTRNDPELFKKLNAEIWEFRTHYGGAQYRLLAFWDKTSAIKTLVVCSHGFIKKQSKVPTTEIQKSMLKRKKYFEKKI